MMMTEMMMEMMMEMRKMKNELWEGNKAKGLEFVWLRDE